MVSLFLFQVSWSESMQISDKRVTRKHSYTLQKKCLHQLENIVSKLKEWYLVHAVSGISGAEIFSFGLAPLARNCPIMSLEDDEHAKQNVDSLIPSCL